MAINTRSKRASILGLATGLALTLPLSDGTVGQPDRQHVALCYPGITATDPGATQAAWLSDFFEADRDALYFTADRDRVYFTAGE